MLYPTGTVDEQGITEVNSVYTYGGDAVDDNSGELTCLILEYTGARSSADVEHNGLTLNGVGNNTNIENIFIPEGSDDGIEFFGGTVNITNLLVVNSDDDMFDFTQGYSGTLKNVYGIWGAGDADSAVSLSTAPAKEINPNTGYDNARVEGGKQAYSAY